MTQLPDKGALHGVRVVELAQVAAGPYAASLLGDMGADVIKIEPVEGEPFRTIDCMYGPTDSAYFFAVNRSKRGLALDLKDPEGKAVLRRLLAGADVFLVSMRPTALARLGLTYEELHEDFPRLIYCVLSAFGESGPRAGQPGIDILVQACGGIMGTTGEPGRPPVKVGPPITDFATSFLSCFGIVAALRVKEQTGKGQKVSLSLLDTSMAMMTNFITPYLRSRVPVRPVGGGHPQMAPYQTFLASDGQWVMVACLTQQFWRNFCEAIGRTELVADHRFRTNVDRVRNRAALGQVLNPIFLGRSSRDWEKLLIEYDVPVAKVNVLEDALQDPQVVYNEMVTSVHHPVYGDIPVTNHPIRMSRSVTHVNRYAPGIGEHTDEILRSAGISDGEIEVLKASGVVRQS